MDAHKNAKGARMTESERITDIRDFIVFQIKAQKGFIKYMEGFHPPSEQALALSDGAISAYKSILEYLAEQSNDNTQKEQL